MSPEPTIAGNGESKPKAPALPPFYVRPEPLAAARFKGKSLARKMNFAFARKTNSIPLNGTEFAAAQHNYPIVFGPGAAALPQAVVGLRKAENLFVDKNGKWAKGTYLPAFVRRYPFILVKGRKDDEYRLYVDTASELVVADESNPFYKDGKPSKFVEEVGNFCRELEIEHAKTRQFCAALGEQKLLESKRVEVTGPGGKKLALGPFQVVNTSKFAALPDAVVVDWHRKGWLGCVYAHLMSLGNWAALTLRMDASES